MGESHDVPGMSRRWSTESDEWVVTSRHSWDGEKTLVQTVVEALVDATDQPAESLTPLHRCVDVDALEAIFAPHLDGTPRPDTGAVSFVVDDHEVLVEADGHVAVRPFR